MCERRSVRLCCYESPHGEAIDSLMRLFHTVSEQTFSETQFPANGVLGNLSLSCVALYVLRGQWLHRTFPQGACCLYLMSCREGYPSRKLSLPSTPPSGGGHVRGRPNRTRSQSFSNRVRRDYHSSSGAIPPGAISYA